jgi:hypothetical protein
MVDNVQHPKLHPVCSLVNKQNFKRMARVLPDGSIIERIYLQVPDMRHREYLICMHYLRHITRHFLRSHVNFEIVSRDNPWDFRIRLSNGTEFNVEITSIADNFKQFENNKSMERHIRWSSEKRIPFHELKRLESLFPDEQISQLVAGYIKDGVSINKLLPNPFYPPEKTLFVSALYDSGEDLLEILKCAIARKAAKKHTDKENTVLLVDNRTGAFDVTQYFDALGKIAPLLQQSPFAEIWFYTGYYSDNDGNNAEFSFAPMKTREAQSEILDKMAQNTDEHGVYYW